ncbi:hypothetical protein CC85DRAFT_325338 [Cutaneotrichosporon oleaginosum]|uniref:Uncharacterized protein n=1 Tax=Cutaneotrichosporon oleaginosum TaxID=879819 RepID=A0A0J0XX10_9TREE|nr:uncharacterized protein CC85DRAFT_325338 [Cutaneotrichosporon oleaginosum]KLT45602.1 hypothetical protein CC85DRAFT_325338 [Cutaneotrichosporon oleaginosum]TXT04601.1 hypothetical protein COLE_07420 [Cutaneotrichosporon oleaginosum]
MGELISAAIISQVARVATDFGTAVSKTGIMGIALAQQGLDIDVLGRLVGALSLRPREPFADALTHAAPLHGRFASSFLAQILPESVPTIQLKLAESERGRALLLLVSALACAAPPKHVLSLLRELIALTHALKRVADLPEAYLHACAHAPTMCLVEDDVACHVDWYTAVLECSGGGGGARRASARDLAAALIAFGRAQAHAHTYVRIRNLTGLEALLAALTALFGAQVRVGAYMPRGAGPTRIVCEFGDGPPSVAVVRAGAPPLEYVSAGEAPRPTLSVGQVRARARARLARAAVPWAVLAGAGAYAARAVAPDLAVRAEILAANEASSKLEMIARDWVAEFARAIDIPPLSQSPAVEGGGDDASAPPPSIHFFINAAAESKVALKTYVAKLGPVGAQAQALWDEPGVPDALRELWLTSLLSAVYGSPASGLEVRARAVERWKIPSGVNSILSVLEVVPAYDGVEAGVQGRTRAAAAVQAGAYVLLPRFLAEESVGAPDDSLLLMLPGVFRLDGVAVDGFFPEDVEAEEASGLELSDLRDVEPPADASASADFQYHYAEAERGYALRVLAAGYPMPLNAAINGVLRVRRLRAFHETGEHGSWLKAAPHQAVAGTYMSWFQKRVYLCHDNHAGRLLAFSRVGERREHIKAVFFEGDDYRQALAYADRHQCKVVIV